MAGKEYTLADGVLFNGARDTGGGIWIRVDDDDDHRIMAAAIAKQIKNTEAAKGTLSAIDPNAPHMLDYAINALQRVLDSVNGARPAAAQLAGTPMGDAIEGTDSSGAGGRKRGRKRGKYDGKQAAEARADTAGAVVGAIEWGSDVPSPRPAVGTAFWAEREFGTGTPRYARAVLGYDPENGHFIVDAGDVGPPRHAIVYNAAWGQWVGADERIAAPGELTTAEARDALGELIAALRAGPADLEDSQFEAAANVACTLLTLVATEHGRTGEMRSVAEFIDEYRPNAENAVELAGGIEYDLQEATQPGPSTPGYEIVEDETPARFDPPTSGIGGAERLKAAAKKAAGKRPAAKKAAGKAAGAGKGGVKRKR